METNEERKERLEKIVATKQLRLAMETEKERRARLENDAATKRLRLAMDGRGKKSNNGEDDSYHTAQVDPGDRGRKKSKTGTSVR